jgi:hypothetical protein
VAFQDLPAASSICVLIDASEYHTAQTCLDNGIATWRCTSVMAARLE